VSYNVAFLVTAIHFNANNIGMAVGYVKAVSVVLIMLTYTN